MFEDIIRAVKSISDFKGYILLDELLKITTEAGLTRIDKAKLFVKLNDLKINIKKNSDVDKDEKIRNQEIKKKKKVSINFIYDKIIELDSDLEAYINKVRKIPQYKKIYDDEIIFKFKSGLNSLENKRAYEMFLSKVIEIAYEYYEKYRIEIADSIGWGNIGIIKAYEMFDPARYNYFSSYLELVVRSHIERNCNFSPNYFYYGSKMKEYVISYREELVKLMENYELCIDDAIMPDLQEKIKINRKVENEKDVLLQLIEPDDIDNYDNDESEKEIYIENLLYNIDCEVEKKDCRDNISKVLQKLKDREREVLEYRFGFKGRMYTLEEIAGMYGITRERVRQIEQRSLDKLREKRFNKYLKDYY